MEKAHPHGLVAGVQKLGDIGDSETTCGDGVQHLHLDGSCGGRVGASAACGLPRGASLPPSWPSASLPRAWAGLGSSRHPGLRQLALNCESLTWAHTCSQACSQQAWTSVRPLVRTGQAPGRSLPWEAPRQPPPVIHRGAGGLGVQGVEQAASPLDPTSHLGSRHPRMGVWRGGRREDLSSVAGGVGGVPRWLLPESRGWMHWFGAHPGHRKRAPQWPPGCGHGPARVCGAGPLPTPRSHGLRAQGGASFLLPPVAEGHGLQWPPRKQGPGVTGDQVGGPVCAQGCVYGGGGLPEVKSFVLQL